MTIKFAVGDRVRTLRELGPHPAGVETTIESIYDNPFADFDYRLELTGSIVGLPLAVYASEIEAL